jgi:hypothetical protein
MEADLSSDLGNESLLLQCAVQAGVGWLNSASCLLLLIDAAHIHISVRMRQLCRGIQCAHAAIMQRHHAKRVT